MTNSDFLPVEKREVPRYVLYPLFLILTVASIVSGILVGNSDIGKLLVVWPGQNGPTENWVLFFISISVSALLVFAKWYSDQKCPVTILATVICIVFFNSAYVIGRNLWPGDFGCHRGYVICFAHSFWLGHLIKLLHAQFR